MVIIRYRVETIARESRVQILVDKQGVPPPEGVDILAARECPRGNVKTKKVKFPASTSLDDVTDFG